MRIPSSLLWSLSLWQFLIAGTVSESVSVSVSDEFLSNSESQSHLRSRSLQAPVSDPSTVTTTTTNSQSLQQQQQQQPPPLVVRTDLVRLVPFQVQIAIKDDTSPNEAELVSDILYEGGTLLTDTISDWMVASFAAKSTGPAGELLGIGNSTSFDSIALELVANSNSQGQIDGRVLNLVQVSFEGVSLWERRGVGTAPMEQDLVELMERATFLEDRKLRTDLQKTVNNLLYDLGIDDGDVEGDQSITIVDVRAYITPPGSGFQDGDKNGSGSGSNNDILLGGSSGKDSSETPAGNNNNRNSNSNANKNLEIIIIVAIVVACLAFALLVFAVCWAWRADRRDRQKPSSSSSARGSAGGGASAGASSSDRKRRSVNTAAGKKRTYRAQTNSHDDNDNDDDETDGDNNGAANANTRSANTNAKTKANIRRGGSAKAQQGSSGRGLFSRKFSQKSAAASSSSAPAVSKASSNGSYPRVIGDTSRANADNEHEHEHEHDESTYNSPKGSRDQDDSVISSDISSSLSAYYKSNFHTGSGGNNSNSNGRTTGNGGGAKDFNDAASMSSMDSYGYSLDGYAPSLGPAQGGYPVGPLHAARDAPIPIGTSQDEQNAHDDDDDMGNIRQMMDDESIVDYEAEA
eukprot:jgi/Psemu1/10325/gm1.10325_g